MAKPKSRWVCQECGTHSTRFMGRCTDCGTWNSLVEEILSEEPAAGKGKGARSVKPGAGPTPLDSVDSDEIPRILSGIEAVDDVLGGGLVPGSVILLAGDPGIGKSTLLLQISAMIARTAHVLYVSGEESAQQVSHRASRLGITSPRILVDSEQNM